MNDEHEEDYKTSSDARTGADRMALGLGLLSRVLLKPGSIVPGGTGTTVGSGYKSGAGKSYAGGVR